ncbi:DUF3891 domain-containing protein [Chroococcidiopsis sp. CCALA 051]|uniref:DUF3891 family protein n=1 Tax=Chroococcidiopsis sp. CCALA 051 TaxID=869949 RepID=UPI000D0D7B18|nr:DUF3891 family protein [Chroococcidiopsis sp. CCALA 051]PSM49949.1 DUF3891 domain-containing protein [Chroococcidiopsis sp. CCALA 051]
MLHRQTPTGIIAIAQPTHAWIAGCLAQAWGNQDFGTFAPKAEVCLGAAIHDIGWVFWENEPTLNLQTGYPHNFMELPSEISVKIWSGVKHLTSSYGRYAALLVSLHGTGLFERFRKWENSPESTQLVEAYLQQEYAYQKQLVNYLQNDSYYANHTTPEVIQRNRKLVAIWDLLSLALCMGLREERQFHDIPTASGEMTLTLIPVDDNFDKIKVEPWAFERDEVKLNYDGRVLNEKFTDETQMRQALANAEWVNMSTVLIPM